MTRTAASMKIAVMLSICALSWWLPKFDLASAMEIRFPGLGKLSLQFHMEPGVEKVSNSDQASTSDDSYSEDSEGEPTTAQDSKDQTDSPQLTTKESPKENATEQAVPKEETEQPNQTAATEATTKKDEQPTTKAEKEAATTEAVKQAKEVTTEKPSDIQKQETTEAAKTEAAKTEAATEEDEESETDSPEPKEEETEAKPPAATEATKKKDEVTPEAKKEAATTKAAKNKEATTENAPDNKQKQVTEASQTEEPTEADKDENTTSEAESPKDSHGSDDDLVDDFDDSDIWDDTVDPPQEFGQEYDLEPDQLQDHADKSDMDDRFAPKLQLPFDLLRDMFYKPNQSEPSGSAPAPRLDSFFDRLKSFLSPAQLMDRLDRIPGQIQAMVDGLRQKRSDGLKSLREKLDSMTESVGKKFGDRFGKGAAGNENLEKCVEKIQPAFNRYESVLQKGIQPCVDKTQRSMRNHDSQIQRILAASSEALTDVKDCASKMGGSIGEMFRSVISFGSCTTNKFKNKIEHLLGPQLEKLTGMIGKHKEDTEAQINEAIQCVEHRLHVPKLEKLQEKLLDKINC